MLEYLILYGRPSTNAYKMIEVKPNWSCIEDLTSCWIERRHLQGFQTIGTADNKWLEPTWNRPDSGFPRFRRDNFHRQKAKSRVKSISLSPPMSTARRTRTECQKCPWTIPKAILFVFLEPHFDLRLPSLLPRRRMSAKLFFRVSFS